MSRRVALLPALLCAAALLLAACARSPQYQPLPRGAVVLAFGDSVTHGTGAGPGEDYPTRLAALTGWQIENHGIPGDTARAAKQRIRPALDEVKPQLVIVEIGGNDFLRRHPEDETRENVRAIVTAVRQRDIPVLLVAVPKFSLVGAAFGALPDAEFYAEIAKQEKVPLLPDLFADILSDNTLKADPIHPNAQGYAKLAEGIAARARELGLLPK